ncbi:MAG: RpoL/Rpb11 RNA polymerase subunit family protein [Candidatus Hermodarchaeota archaeon]
MELRRISKDETSMEIEFKGEDHTFLNLLREAITNNDHHAAYKMNHPLLSAPSFFIRAKDDSSPENIISEACDQIDKTFEELEKIFQAALNKTK